MILRILCWKDPADLPAAGSKPVPKYGRYTERSRHESRIKGRMISFLDSIYSGRNRAAILKKSAARIRMTKEWRVDVRSNRRKEVENQTLKP